jgi:hypothetical protein
MWNTCQNSQQIVEGTIHLPLPWCHLLSSVVGIGSLDASEQQLIKKTRQMFFLN